MYRWKAASGRPVFAHLDDLVVVSADEVPPHDDLLGERLAAEEQEPPGAPYRQAGPAAAEVEQRPGLEREAVDFDRALDGQDRVLVRGLERQVGLATGLHHDLGADDRRVGTGRRAGRADLA